MQQELLPLFPLQIVLLPGSTIALHIFEDRYKEMIGEAIRDRSEFGVVLANEKGIVNTGCTAVVDKIVQMYPDGRLDILAGARRRFEILSLDEDRSFLRGAVEFFDDDAGDAASAEMMAKTMEGYRELKNIESEASESEPDVASAQFSFQVADIIPDLNFRQTLLATRSEADRIRQLAEYLPGLIERLRRSHHVKAVAPSNGHSAWPAGLQ
jgi:Lon protease-like protein